MVGQSLDHVHDEAQPRPSMKMVLSSVLRKPEMTAVLMLLLVGGFLSVANSTFRTVDNIVWVMHSFSIIAIAAMGVLLLIVSGTIDLSSGAQIGMAAIVTGWIIYYHPGTPDLVIFAAAIASGLAFGVLNAIMCAKFGLNSFIATLATSYVGQGLNIIISGNITFQGYPQSLMYIGQGSILGLPILVWIMIALMVLWHWVLTRTTYGRWVFAIGGNERTAKLSGVPVDAVRMSTYLLSGFMCSLAGFLYSIRMGVASANMAAGYNMDIIAGSVIGGVSVAGGTGTIVGVVLGASLMAIIRNGLVLLKIGALWQQLVTGLVAVLSVVLDRMRRINE